MARIPLPYGKKQLTLDFNAHFDGEAEIFFPRSIPDLNIMTRKEIVEAISSAYSDFSISNDNSIAISVNDPTRPIPYDRILPPLIRCLKDRGATDENITLYIATGTHRNLTKKEKSAYLPDDVLKKYRTIVHNCDDGDNLINLGYSVAGTPIHINKRFYRSDIKIVTGHIEPHHFMGFSGGVKSAAIGLAGRKTIETNHRMLILPDAVMGRYESNPMRMDIEDIGKKMGIDLALNVVLDNGKNIVGVFFGSPANVMKQGITLSRKLCQIQAPTDFDLVICSAGGYPKDVNLYQAQKAITHACAFLKEGRTILLIAECREGFGSQGFQKFIEKHQFPTEIINAFEQSPFKIGPHKAYQLALQALKHKIILISRLPKDNVLQHILHQANSLSEGLAMSRIWLPDNPKVAVLPYATHLMNLRGDIL